MAKLLLVDDSMVVAGVLDEFLSGEGHEIVHASDGLEGIIKAYQAVPDLIISDVEMPRLQGYQMSRLLKKRREIHKIPLIMHTSLSEDRDRFWALSSGADAFVNKDFDNLERLAELVTELVAAAEKPDRTVIAEDAREVNEERVMEMLGAMFDHELFRSTTLNELGAVERYIASLSQSAREVLKLLSRVCDADIGALVLSFGRSRLEFYLPSPHVVRSDLTDFETLCRVDYDNTVHQTAENSERTVFGIEDRADFDKLRSDNRRLSSYLFFPLKGKEVIGTLHVGNLSNNYFSDSISDSVAVFARGAEQVLVNSLLFNRIAGMEKKIRTVFSKFVPPEIIDDLLDRPENSTEMAVGEKRSVAILFSDIRSFTVISENNSAESIVAALNSYFQLMVSEIKKQGGVIDKFIGDAILAVFGAPLSYEDNAARAVRAARGMIERLQDVPVQDLKLPESGFQIGIGIHEGTVIVGNIGSQDKFDYTVIGDNVNLASRLEGITKHYHRKIIVSEVVAEKVRDDAPLRQVDTVKVKGKEQSTALYSVETALDEPLNGHAMQEYKKGLQLYRMQSWTTAIEYFEKVRAAYPDDFLSAMYIERCREFSQAPPGEDWNGSITLDFK